jgi:hypothetical protein
VPWRRLATRAVPRTATLSITTPRIAPSVVDPFGAHLFGATTNPTTRKTSPSTVTFVKE